MDYDDYERLSLSTLGVQDDDARTIREPHAHDQLDAEDSAEEYQESNALALVGVNLEAEIASLASRYDRRPAGTNDIMSVQARPTFTQSSRQLDGQDLAVQAQTRESLPRRKEKSPPRGLEPLTKELQEGENLQIRERSNIELHHAIAEDNTLKVENLLKEGLDVNAVAQLDVHKLREYTPLGRAIETNSEEVVQLLLNYRADIELFAFPSKGYTPLFFGN